MFDLEEVDWNSVGQTVGQLLDVVVSSTDGTTTEAPVVVESSPSTWETLAPIAAVGGFVLALFAVMRR